MQKPGFHPRSFADMFPHLSDKFRRRSLVSELFVPEIPDKSEIHSRVDIEKSKTAEAP